MQKFSARKNNREVSVLRYILTISFILPLTLFVLACSGASVEAPPVEEAQLQEPVNTDNDIDLLQEFKQCQSFLQAEQKKTDVLFVIDDSGSMAGEQAALADAVDSFTTAIANLSSENDLDFHIGVTSTDTGNDGRLYGFVDQNTPNLKEVLTLLLLVGTDGSGYEPGLEAMKRAIDPDYIHNAPGGANEGFRRDDASLEVVIVSDEDDDSANPPISQPWQSYADFLDGLVDPDEGWRVSGVVHKNDSAFDDLTDPNCGNNKEDSPGFGYLDIIAFSLGILESLCNGTLYAPDFSGFLELLAITSFDAQQFFQLETEIEPDPATIEVSIDGELLDPSAYSYNQENKQVLAESPLLTQNNIEIEICYLEEGLGDF